MRYKNTVDLVHLDGSVDAVDKGPAGEESNRACNSQ